MTEVHISEFQIFIFIAQLGVIIFLARFIGELAKRCGQPIMVGELLAGIVLGPSVFGVFFPAARDFLFPATGPNAYLLQGFSWLCVLFLLMVTGLEIDLPAAMRHGKQNILTSLFAVFIPFICVFTLLQFYLPESFYVPGVEPLHLQLMLSVAMAVVAIPVISKILFDLNILRSNVGLNILTSGVLCDIWGWTILIIIIHLITQGSLTLQVILKPVVIMALYFGIALTAGRWITDRIVRWLNIQLKEAAGMVAFLFAFTLLNGAIAHVFGIHVIFGAFVAGLMAGESKQITPHLRQSTQDLIFGLFAPIFFVLVGMKLKFSLDFNWTFIIILFVVTSVTKILGAYLGGLISGLGRLNAFAVSCGLNALGTMGVIVALIGLEMKVFNAEAFFTIVVLCIATDLVVGPLLKWAIKGVRRPLAQYFDREHVFLDVPGKTKEEIIQNMAKLMAERKIVEDAQEVGKAILRREESMSTAIGGGVALPHARILDLEEPVLCFFRLKEPVNFESPDNIPVQLLFLELTDSNDNGMQLNLISQVARFISSEENKQKLLKCKREDEIHHILSMDEKV